jgi:hypothetical protein
MPAPPAAAGSSHAGTAVGGREQASMPAPPSAAGSNANFDFEQKNHNLPLLSTI